jgi:hypothetical protein
MLQRLAEGFPWLHAVADLVRLGAFLAFAALGLRIVWLQSRRRDAQPAIAQFIAFAIVVTCLTGFTQIEAWPFSNWSLIHHISHRNMVDWIVEGVDASGKAYRLDARFVEPMPYEDFDTWLKTGFMRLGRTEEEAKVCYLKAQPSTPEQQRVARYLVARAEIARLRFRRGQSPGHNDWLLGRLTAPYHFDRRNVWRAAGDVPATPFVGLRIWQIEWNVEERYRDESRITRHLLFDYRT